MAYLLWDGGALHFDATMNEGVTLTAQVTKHPVESGADITDHVRDDPDHVKLDVFVSGDPLRDVNNLGAQLVVKDTITAYGTTSRSTSLEFPGVPNFVRDMVRKLEELKTNATLVDVVTHARYCASMIITSIESTPRGPNSASISMALEQIRIVSTGTAAAPQPTQPRDQPQKTTGAQQPKDADAGTNQSLGVAIGKWAGVLQ